MTSVMIARVEGQRSRLESQRQRLQRRAPDWAGCVGRSTN